MMVLTDFPDRIKPGLRVYLGEDHLPMRMIGVRKHRERLVLRFHGVNTREQADALQKKLVFVSRDEIPALPEGEYYHHQLIGLHVQNEEGEGIGILKEILETGAHDVLVVMRNSGTELLLPYRDEVVLQVDLAAGRMVVRVLPGLE